MYIQLVCSPEALCRVPGYIPVWLHLLGHSITVWPVMTCGQREVFAENREEWPR